MPTTHTVATLCDISPTGLLFEPAVGSQKIGSGDYVDAQFLDTFCSRFGTFGDKSLGYFSHFAGGFMSKKSGNAGRPLISQSRDSSMAAASPGLKC